MIRLHGIATFLFIVLAGLVIFNNKFRFILDIVRKIHYN